MNFQETSGRLSRREFLIGAGLMAAGALAAAACIEGEVEYPEYQRTMRDHYDRMTRQAEREERNRKEGQEERDTWTNINAKLTAEAIKGNHTQGNGDAGSCWGAENPPAWCNDPSAKP